MALSTGRPARIGQNCSRHNLVWLRRAGEVSKYQFADGVHPTPCGYQPLAQFVSKSLALKGWL